MPIFIENLDSSLHNFYFQDIEALGSLADEIKQKKSSYSSYQLAIHIDTSNHFTLQALLPSEMNSSYEPVDDLLKRISKRIEQLAVQILSTLSLENLKSASLGSENIYSIFNCLSMKNICTAFGSVEAFVDKFLLEKDSAQITVPLYLASHPKLHPILIRLLEIGAISNKMLSHKQGYQGYNMLMIASEKNCVELLDGIFRSPYFTQDLLLLEDDNSNTLLHIAASEGSVDIIQYMLDRNYISEDLLCTSQALNIRDSSGMSLAMYVSDKRELEVWRWILNSPGYSRSVLVQRDFNDESCASRLIRTGLSHSIEDLLSLESSNFAVLSSFKAYMNAIKKLDQSSGYFFYHELKKLSSNHLKGTNDAISVDIICKSMTIDNINYFFGDVETFIQSYFVSESEQGDHLLNYLCSKEAYHPIVSKLFELGWVEESMLLHQNKDGESALMILLRKKTEISNDILFNPRYSSDQVLSLRNNEGDTILHLVMEKFECHFERALYILEHRLSEGLFVNVNNQGKTLLMLSVEQLNEFHSSKVKEILLKIVSYLLGSAYMSEAFLLEKDKKSGLTALALSCKLGLSEYSQRILNLPSCTSKVLSERCILGRTAIAYALEDLDLIEAFFRSPHFYEKHLLEEQGEQNSTLSYALISGNSSMMDLALQCYPNLLHALLKKDSLEIMILMKESMRYALFDEFRKEIKNLRNILFTEEFCTTEVLSQQKDGDNLLLWLYENNRWDQDVLKKILKMPACTSQVLNLQNKEGYTLAMRAVIQGNYDLLKCILGTPGFSMDIVEIQDFIDKENLLMHAIRCRSLTIFKEIFQIIRRRDIDLLLEKNNQGLSIFAMAFQKEAPYSHLQLLLEHLPWESYERIRFEIQKVFFNLCLNQHHDNKLIELIEYLPLKLLFQIRNEYGYTALSVAIQSSNLDFIRAIFVKCKYQFDAKNMMNLVDNQQKNAWFYAKENNLENQIQSFISELPDLSPLDLSSES